MKKVYLIAVVIAIMAGFATYLFASEINDKTTIKDADVITVYIPIEDIERNTVITEEMFAKDGGKFVQKTIIADDAYPNAAQTKEELVDMITIEKLYKNEQINKERIQPKDSPAVPLSSRLEKGMVAYSFSAASVTSVDGYINEGDTVNVLVTETGDDGLSKSRVEYKDLKILRISARNENDTASSAGTAIKTYGTLTVEVTQEQALRLYDIENNYSFKLVLNPKA